MATQGLSTAITQDRSQGKLQVKTQLLKNDCRNPAFARLDASKQTVLRLDLDHCAKHTVVLELPPLSPRQAPWTYDSQA